MGSGSPWCGCRLSCLCLLLWKTARGRVFLFGRRLQPHEGYMCSETLSLFLSNVLDLRCLDLNHFSQKTINTKCAILDLVSRGNKALHLFKPKRLKSTLYFRPMTKVQMSEWPSGIEPTWRQWWWSMHSLSFAVYLGHIGLQSTRVSCTCTWKTRARSHTLHFADIGGFCSNQRLQNRNKWPHVR